MTTLNCNYCGHMYASSEVEGKTTIFPNYTNIYHNCPVCKMQNMTKFITKQNRILITDF
jgi:hypothetical protein